MTILAGAFISEKFGAYSSAAHNGKIPLLLGQCGRDQGDQNIRKKIAKFFKE
jgi:hypothetical protein